MNTTSTHRIVTFAPTTMSSSTMHTPPPGLARHESSGTEASLDSFYWKHGGAGTNDHDSNSNKDLNEQQLSFDYSFDETGSFRMARATLKPLQQDSLVPTTTTTTTTTTMTMAKVPKAPHPQRTMTLMNGQPYYARQESARSLCMLSSWGSLTFEETSSHYSAGSNSRMPKNRTTTDGSLSVSNHKRDPVNHSKHPLFAPRPTMATSISKKNLLVNYRQESNISLMSSWGSLDFEQDEDSILSQKQQQQEHNEEEEEDDDYNDDDAVMPTLMRSVSNSVEPGNNSLAAFRQKQQQRLLQRSISLKQMTSSFRKQQPRPSPSISMLESVKNGYYA